MYFRFAVSIVLVVLVSLAGIGLEKRNLELRRQLTVQQYRLDQLLETHAKLRLATQRMGAPTRLYDALKRGDMDVKAPERPMLSLRKRLPLLNWQRPATTE